MKITPALFLRQPQSITVDIKNLSESLVAYQNEGVEFVQTKYFLKKDCYSWIVGKNLDKILICNVN